MLICMIVGRVRESQTAIKVTNRVKDCIPRLACNEFKIELIDLKPSDLPFFAGSHRPATGTYDQPKQQQ